jgi:hypothetical protein
VERRSPESWAIGAYWELAVLSSKRGAGMAVPSYRLHMMLYMYHWSSGSTDMYPSMYTTVYIKTPEEVDLYLHPTFRTS